MVYYQYYVYLIMQMSPLTSLLHDSIRGTLDNIIDNCITWIPEWATEYRRKKQRRFALGLTIGMIYANFETFFLTTHRRQLDPQERVEVMIEYAS